MPLGTLARTTGLYDLAEPIYSSRQIKKWEAAGRPIPAPSAVKRDVLRQYADRHGLRVLVETGTYKADTVRALRGDFDTIHSVEIDADLYAAAVARCKGQENAVLHHGDSGEVLTRIVEGLTSPALFWLDAHHSGGETGGDPTPPIMAELETILNTDLPHVILIDDIREFGADVNYPTIDAIHAAAETHSYLCEIRDDIARLTRLA